MDEATSVGLATSLKYTAEGWVDVLHDSQKRPIGLWLKSADWGEHEHAILKLMCSVLKVQKEKGDRREALPDDLCMQIYAGYYRMVENATDRRGGVLVLVSGATPPRAETGTREGHRIGILGRLFGRDSRARGPQGQKPAPLPNEAKVSIAEIDKLVFAILAHVIKPRGLSNDHEVDFFDARCDGCGSHFPAKDLSRLATRISMRRAGATVATTGGVDVYACPQCDCSTALVRLHGMTDEELARVVAEL
jgi:hypothetical protein